MKRTAITTLLIMATLVGCVPSIHGIATKENTVWDDNLIGTWGDPNHSGDPNAETWQFTKGKEDSRYTLRQSNDGKVGEFHVALVQLGEALFLDIFPSGNESIEKANDFYKAHLLAAHTFMIVDEVGERLRMRMMSPDKVKDMVDKDPSLVKHEMRDDQVVLTAGATELQEFLVNYADKIFGDKDKDGSGFVKL
jgi:hypothetical protein